MMKRHKYVEGENRYTQASEPSKAGPFWRVLLSFALPALLAGLVASLLAVVLMGVLRVFFGVPTPVELFGQFVLKHLDANTFVLLLLTYKDNPKTGPLGLALLGMVCIGTVLGLLYAQLSQVQLPVRGLRPGRREWLIALIFAITMTLIGVLLFWNELRANFLGLLFETAIMTTILGMLADFLLYSLTLALVYRTFLPTEASGVTTQSLSRRRLFSQASTVLVAIAAGIGFNRLLHVFLQNYSSYDGTGPDALDVTPSLTPNDQHYVVTQNVVDPTVNVDLWRLEVEGLVKNTGSHSYTELQQLPSVARAITLECIANGVGRARLMSTAIWQGIALSTLLAHHGGALSHARYVSFYCADGYNVSLPLNEVLEADALLAWRMNGDPLPNRHGFPLRVLIPGRYGEENPKWVTRIELTEQFVSGLYSSQGWYNGPLHTTSRIDRPKGQTPLVARRQVEVGGIAFAGNRGIRKVELSVDGGQSWQEARLQPPLSKDSWVQWSLPWTPMQAGTYTLVVRATDGTGEVQTSREQGTVPNGATGYHKVPVTVIAK
jgi:DMSO/TMAO reductase YedYZ molybdopterin-dependent catalytic subunit